MRCLAIWGGNVQCQKLDDDHAEHSNLTMGVKWLRGCERCNYTGRVPRPPEGDPPWQREYNQSIPCPKCRPVEIIEIKPIPVDEVVTRAMMERIKNDICAGMGVNQSLIRKRGDYGEIRDG